MSFQPRLFLNNQDVAVNEKTATSLRFVLEKENDTSFFRRKMQGEIEFLGADYNTLKPIEQDCCRTIPINIFRSCGSNNSLFFGGELNSKKFEWNKDICSVKISQIEFRDLEKGVYRNWEKKINMCTMPQNMKVRYDYRKINQPTGNQTDETFTYPTIDNPRGRLFKDWILFCVTKTFESTEYASLIPQNMTQFSHILDTNINPCTAQQSIFTYATIYQASDFVEPHSEQPATGVLADGRINENLSVNLKDLLNNLKILFRLDWFIDSNGKFRIEHESFFANGFSYSTPQIGFDLSQSKYNKWTSGISYNYRHEFDALYGVEELRLSQNEAINNDERAFSTSTLLIPNTGLYDWILNYQFTKIDDFVFGNIKYDSPCAIENEKGEVQKNTLQCDMFITNSVGASMYPSTLDKTKWVLLDCKELPPSNPDIGVLPQNQVYLIVNRVCERTTISEVPNARLSASAIMKDFHRWERPFERGLMNYSETPNGEKGKGVLRSMYSVKKTKLLTEKISVPYCCTDEFDSKKIILLPNGDKAELKRAEFFLGTEFLELELKTADSCNYQLSFPSSSGTGCLDRGTFLYQEPCIKLVPKRRGLEICYPQLVDWAGIRKFYADGDCGSYFEEIYLPEDEPQDEC